jgi:hypothetical protein
MTGQVLAAMPVQSILVVAQPVEQCCYCWYVLHPQQSYPEAQSSTICEPHSVWILASLSERRQRRAAAADGRTQS